MDRINEPLSYSWRTNIENIVVVFSKLCWSSFVSSSPRLEAKCWFSYVGVQVDFALELLTISVFSVYSYAGSSHSIHRQRNSGWMFSDYGQYYLRISSTRNQLQTDNHVSMCFSVVWYKSMWNHNSRVPMRRLSTIAKNSSLLQKFCFSIRWTRDFYFHSRCRPLRPIYIRSYPFSPIFSSLRRMHSKST